MSYEPTDGIPHGVGPLHALRDHSFREWLEVADIPLPVEPVARQIAVEGLRRAFAAGWAFRKKAVDYAIQGRMN